MFFYNFFAAKFAEFSHIAFLDKFSLNTPKYAFVILSRADILALHFNFIAENEEEKKEVFMKSDLLKALAIKAKNRMMNKNYKKEEAVTACQVKVIDEKDDFFYEQVLELMKSNESIRNPMKRLMNQEVFKSLNPRGQEKYLLDTIEKYLRYKNMIEKENESKIVY